MVKTVQRRSSTVNSQPHISETSKLRIAQQALASLLALVLLCAAYPQRLVAQDAQDQQSPAQVPPGAPHMRQTPENHTNFARKYQEMHRFVKEPDGSVMLYIGAVNWPAPIPLRMKGNAWFFDSEAGKMEILYRRIGRNELSAIRICRELVFVDERDFVQVHDASACHISAVVLLPARSELMYPGIGKPAMQNPSFFRRCFTEIDLQQLCAFQKRFRL